LSRFDSGPAAMPANEGTQAEGVVKWFNSVKGFGFVAIDNNPQDAFLHISVVSRAGLQSLNENTRISCMVAPSQRGMQITRIIEVLGVDTSAASSSSNFGGHGGGSHHGGGSTFSGPEVEVIGTVKWYKTDKGFGFAIPEDGSKDVFVHRSVLARVGLGTIEPGRRIRMKVQTSQKGREASSIELLD
jgi:CspA family cold shock protein